MLGILYWPVITHRAHLAFNLWKLLYVEVGEVLTVLKELSWYPNLPGWWYRIHRNTVLLNLFGSSDTPKTRFSISYDFRSQNTKYNELKLTTWGSNPAPNVQSIGQFRGFDRHKKYLHFVFFVKSVMVELKAQPIKLQHS